MIKEILPTIPEEHRDSVLQGLEALRVSKFFEIIAGYRLATVPANCLNSENDTVIRTMTGVSAVNNFLHEIVGELGTLSQDLEEKEE